MTKPLIDLFRAKLYSSNDALFLDHSILIDVKPSPITYPTHCKNSLILSSMMALNR